MMTVKVQKYNAQTTVVLVSVFLMTFLSRNIVAVTIVLCSLLYSSSVFREARYLGYRRSEVKWLILYLLSFAVSCIFSINHITSVREFLVECLIYLWLIVMFVASSKYGLANHIIQAYIISSCLISLLFTGAHLLKISSLSFVDNVELVKTWNHFCFYVGAAAVILFVRFIRRHSVLSILGILLIFLAIGLATGRGATISIIVACLVVYLETSTNSWKRKALVVIVALLMIFTYQHYSHYIEQVANIFDPTSSFSNRERYAMWQACLEMFRDHPFGVGIGNWADVYNAQYRRTTLIYPHAHNFFLQTLCELGMLGGISTIGLFGNSIWTTAKNYFRYNNYVSLCIHGVLIYSVVDLMFNNPLNNSKPLILLFTMFAIGYSENIHPIVTTLNIRL